jgi:hypothetical protein
MTSQRASSLNRDEKPQNEAISNAKKVVSESLKLRIDKGHKSKTATLTKVNSGPRATTAGSIEKSMSIISIRLEISLSPNLPGYYIDLKNMGKAKTTLNQTNSFLQ